MTYSKVAIRARGRRLGGSCLAVLAAVAAHGAAGVSAQQIPAPRISPDLPADVEIPAGFPGIPTVFFDDFSWRSFIALNWPALTGQRGVGDPTRPVGDLTVPRVWDTWKADFELFQEREAPPPSGWASFDATTPCPGVADNRRKILAGFSKIGGFNQAGFGADVGPLVARNRTYVRYEVRLNEPEFRTILDNQYYLQAKLPEPAAPADFADGSIEVKAAWREFTAAEPAAVRARYYTVKALASDPRTGQCDEREMGLVGLHIVAKTPSRPQWIWSSFEHVDNLPEPGGSPGAQAWTFNDGDPAPTKQKLDPTSRPPITPTNLPELDPSPNQVVRVRPINSSTSATNAAWQQALTGTIWENYQLVTTQWPTEDLATPGPTKDGKPFPPNNAATSLANTTMETYLQKSSCMRCHQAANKAGDDFVWFMRLRAFPTLEPDGAGPANVSAAAAAPRRADTTATAIQELRALVAEGHGG